MKDTTEMDTERVLDIAQGYAEEHDIDDVVVATTTGETGAKAAALFGDGYNVVAVTHATGFREPGEQELQEEHRRRIEDNGGTVFTGPMVFHSWNDFYRKRRGSVMPTTVIADTLRMFGQGTKVAVEVAAMAADAGLIEPAPTLCIAGTGRGADTVLLVDAAHSKWLMDTRVVDVVAKPTAW